MQCFPWVHGGTVVYFNILIHKLYIQYSYLYFSTHTQYKVTNVQLSGTVAALPMWYLLHQQAQLDLYWTCKEQLESIQVALLPSGQEDQQLHALLSH